MIRRGGMSDEFFNHLVYLRMLCLNN